MLCVKRRSRCLEGDKDEGDDLIGFDLVRLGTVQNVGFPGYSESTSYVDTVRSLVRPVNQAVTARECPVHSSNCIDKGTFVCVCTTVLECYCCCCCLW